MPKAFRATLKSACLWYNWAYLSLSAVHRDIENTVHHYDNNFRAKTALESWGCAYIFNLDVS